MRKLIEFFKWDFEGEYQQYFYVVENEEDFVQEVLTYLNTIQTHKEFSWANCLSEFKEEDSVESHFLQGYVEHLKEYYYIEEGQFGLFSLTKTSLEKNETEIRWKN